MKSGGCLDRLLGLFLKKWLPLIKNATKPFAKSLLLGLELAVATSAADAVIHNKSQFSDLQQH